jgi:hypothetical protein
VTPVTAEQARKKLEAKNEQTVEAIVQKRLAAKEG